MLAQLWNDIPAGRKQLKNFGIVVGGILAAIAGLLFWKESVVWVPVGITAAHLVGFGLFLPKLLYPVYKVWMIFAAGLNWVMTRVILSILFYLVITPMGLFGRLFGKSFLDLKFRENRESYWRYRSEPTPRDHCERQY